MHNIAACSTIISTSGGQNVMEVSQNFANTISILEQDEQRAEQELSFLKHISAELSAIEFSSVEEAEAAAGAFFGMLEERSFPMHVLLEAAGEGISVEDVAVSGDTTDQGVLKVIKKDVRKLTIVDQIPQGFFSSIEVDIRSDTAGKTSVKPYVYLDSQNQTHIELSEHTAVTIQPKIKIDLSADNTIDPANIAALNIRRELHKPIEHLDQDTMLESLLEEIKLTEFSRVSNDFISFSDMEMFELFVDQAETILGQCSTPTERFAVISYIKSYFDILNKAVHLTSQAPYRGRRVVNNEQAHSEDTGEEFVKIDETPSTCAGQLIDIVDGSFAFASPAAPVHTLYMVVKRPEKSKDNQEYVYFVPMRHISNLHF